MGTTKKMMIQWIEKSRKRKSDVLEESNKKKRRIEKSLKRKNEEQTNPITIRKCQTNKKPKEERSIQVGDTVNLSELLFTESRDYLVKFNQNKKVKAEELAGKVVVLFFASLSRKPFFCSKLVKHLSDIYSKLHPTGNFEIVFVATKDDIADKEPPSCPTPRKHFIERFSTMAWPAIPFSDLKSRRHLERVFGIPGGVEILPRSFIIDPRGVVLQCHATSLFFRYGAAAYPFTNERIAFLDSEDNVAEMKPSMTNLFANSECNYLISNTGDQVPVHNLEDKVVALFFCPNLFNKDFTVKLKMAYEELLRNKEDFEVVLIYTHGWWDAYRRTDEDSYWKAFQTMPWLALPFEETSCNKKLQRIFKHPQELLGTRPEPRLVIIGPRGEFSEPLGATILLEYGAPAYPFTVSSVTALELEKLKKVELKMLWGPDAVFMNKNTSQVRFSQLVGKRIIVLLQNWRSTLDSTLRELKARYFRMKGTEDEFEVIHICDGEQSMQIAAAMPWLLYPRFDENSYAHEFIKSVFGGHYYGLLAFDRDGAVVRRTSFPVVGDTMVFPFYSDGDMENEVLVDFRLILNTRTRNREFNHFTEM